MQTLTPMMQQYKAIKKQYADCILFFRLGDFYEMFFEDAIAASSILEITLTAKSCGQSQKAPMCGVPWHSHENYLQKLIKAGRKVAICEQTEEAAKTKALVRREVVRVVTPGTLLDDSLLESGQNNYLFVAMPAKTEQIELTIADISTAFQKNLLVERSALPAYFLRYSPREILMPLSLSQMYSREKSWSHGILSQAIREGKLMLSVLENIPALEQKKLPESSAALLSLYLSYTQKRAFQTFQEHPAHAERPVLDAFTIRNLELVENVSSTHSRHTLFSVLNRTKTAMGARLLKSWIIQPLCERKAIEERLARTDQFFQNYDLRTDVRGVLSSMGDLERLAAKIRYERLKDQDFFKLQRSLQQAMHLARQASLSEYFLPIQPKLDSLLECAELLEKAFSEVEFSEQGFLISSSFDLELANLRALSADNASVLVDLEAQERQKTGIKNLKIGYNRVFGYYIEITKSQLKSAPVPPEYTRKQTLASSERFINQALKQLEEKILLSQEQAALRQETLLGFVKQSLGDQAQNLLDLAGCVQRVDVHQALAEAAAEHQYQRPRLEDHHHLIIEEGRHPVIERTMPAGKFIPNATSLREGQIHLLTGPNMAGKSTYMRQVALIVLMAQIGSFVPCKKASLSPVDHIFTRVGANDDLGSGQSTFMVEMDEVAHILREATSNSLIILDEVGRGTSTYDGMSIACSVIEFIAAHIQAKTLVSTHYHELTHLEESLDCLTNYTVAVEEEKDQVIFLRRMVQGRSDRSYGIFVARLAGLPDSLLARASTLLKRFEPREHLPAASFTEPALAKTVSDKGACFSNQQALLTDLQKINTEQMTPIEALIALQELSTRAKEALDAQNP